MVWGERRGHATFGAVKQFDGVPHAAIERSEPIPCRFRSGSHADRRHRNEPIELVVAGLVPGLERRPLKKLSPDQDALLKLVQRWRNEAAQAGREITRTVVAYEAGRDGFWLARWLRRRGIEAYVIHPSSVAVSREHRRAKTDRLDTELLMR